MNKQIIFTPEKEASRDLTYSEYSSCSQSIHVLFQDKGLQGYEFLLKAYRAAVSSYLSFQKIESPAGFLRSLVARFDVLSREAKLSPSEYSGFGAHIVINTGRMLWLLSSDVGSVYVGAAGAYVSCAEANRDLVSEIAVVDGGGQTELFPKSIKDYMRLYAIIPPADEEINILLGCGTEERNAVFEGLQAISLRVAAPGDPLKQYVPLKFVSRKVIAISLSRQPGAPATSIPRRLPLSLAGASHRNVPAITLYIVLIATVVIGGFWGARRLTGERPKVAVPMESRLVPDTDLGATPEGAPPNEPEPHRPAATDAAAIELARQWDRSFGSALTSSPAVCGNAVVIGCRDGNLYALNPLNGETEWKYTSAAGIGASPAVAGDRIVCADYAGNVFCLEAAGGAEVWKRKLPGKISSSPLVVENKVIVGCYDKSLYCLAFGNGDILWQYRTGGIIRATPAASGDLVLVPSYDGNVYALALGTGTERWRYAAHGNLDSSPALAGGRIVVGAPDGTIYALDAAAGSLLWRTKTGGPVKSALAIADGRVYAGSNDTRLYCLALETGSVAWTFKTGDIVLARPFAADNSVLFGSYDGMLYVLNAETGERIAAYSTSAQLFSSPLVVHDTVYFGSNSGTVYSLRFVRSTAS